MHSSRTTSPAATQPHLQLGNERHTETVRGNAEAESPCPGLLTTPLYRNGVFQMTSSTFHKPPIICTTAHETGLSERCGCGVLRLKLFQVKERVGEKTAENNLQLFSLF